MAITDLQFNQPITLADDPKFLGYVFGLKASDDADVGPMVMVSIAQSGKTGLKGNRAIALERIVPTSGRPRERRGE
ncbi:MAG TPA: hypothetical protein VIK33_17490 [Anaerolineae bacterium]